MAPPVNKVTVSEGIGRPAGLLCGRDTRAMPVGPFGVRVCLLNEPIVFRGPEPRTWDTLSLIIRVFEPGAVVTKVDEP